MSEDCLVSELHKCGMHSYVACNFSNIFTQGHEPMALAMTLWLTHWPWPFGLTTNGIQPNIQQCMGPI